MSENLFDAIQPADEELCAVCLSESPAAINARLTPQERSALPMLRGDEVRLMCARCGSRPKQTVSS